MGRRNRERVEQIRAGLEQPISALAREAAAFAGRGRVVVELSKGSVADQIDRLDELVSRGVLPADKLRGAVMRKAPEEMDKAIKKFRREGKEITVDSLLAEVRSESRFLKMCEQVGLTYEWFEKLAKERMEVSGV